MKTTLTFIFINLILYTCDNESVLISYLKLIMMYHSYILDSKLIYWGSAVPLCLWQTKYWSRQTTDGYIWHVRRVYAFNRWRIHPLILSNSIEITISDIVSAICPYYNVLLEKIIRILILSYNRGKLFYVYSSSRPTLMEYMRYS